jgi:hypothetical protein
MCLWQFKYLTCDFDIFEFVITKAYWRLSSNFPEKTIFPSKCLDRTLFESIFAGFSGNVVSPKNLFLPSSSIFFKKPPSVVTVFWSQATNYNSFKDFVKFCLQWHLYAERLLYNLFYFIHAISCCSLGPPNLCWWIISGQCIFSKESFVKQNKVNSRGT